MGTTVGTHSGSFHADDVLAFALIRRFYDPAATVLRTRSRDQLDEVDIVVDVGGVYDPETKRFDHHQASYDGPLSSAGMVLKWLEDDAHVSAPLAKCLRDSMVDYVDAVDTGRQAPEMGRPCFCTMIESMTHLAETPKDLDTFYRRASDLAGEFLAGVVSGFERSEHAREVVLHAMEVAKSEGSSVILLDRYYPWKPVYFEAGGAEHPTEFVLFPSEDGTWKLVAIPPRLGDFGQKRPLPQEWAGKMGNDLVAETGEPGSVFCHKNRFIAVFTSKDAVYRALGRFEMLSPAG